MITRINQSNIDAAFGEDAKFIKEYEIVDKSNNLRFVSRTDYDLHKSVNILQQEMCVKVFFSEPVHRNFGGNVLTDEKVVWLDVPWEVE